MAVVCIRYTPALHKSFGWLEVLNGRFDEPAPEGAEPPLVEQLRTELESCEGELVARVYSSPSDEFCPLATLIAAHLGLPLYLDARLDGVAAGQTGPAGTPLESWHGELEPHSLSIIVTEANVVPWLQQLRDSGVPRRPAARPPRPTRHAPRPALGAVA